MDNRKFFNKKDIIIIGIVTGLAIIAFCLTTLMTNKKGETIQVIYDGEIIKELSVNTDTVYSPEFNPNIIIEVKDKKVHFKTSDCPDKVCVHTGWLSKAGQTAVCLPNKISIVVKPGSNSKDNVDTVL